MGPDYHVLVVDRNSPDETAAWSSLCAYGTARALLVRSTTRLRHRVRDGFGASIGTRSGIRRRDGCRRSHDPAEFPGMARAAGSGRADLVIGSRYVRGSKISAGADALYQRHVAIDARLVTGVPATTPPTACALPPPGTRSLNLSALLSRGYSSF